MVNRDTGVAVARVMARLADGSIDTRASPFSAGSVWESPMTSVGHGPDGVPTFVRIDG